MPTIEDNILMVISPEQLKQFKALYKKRFGKDLTDQEAHEKALKLLSLMKIIYRPLPPEQSETALPEFTDAV